MYSTPDFIKVELKVSDSFAEYRPVGCPQVGAGGGILSGSGCTDTFIPDGMTATSLFPREPNVCYTEFNP